MACGTGNKWSPTTIGKWSVMGTKQFRLEPCPSAPEFVHRVSRAFDPHLHRGIGDKGSRNAASRRVVAHYGL